MGRVHSTRGDKLARGHVGKGNKYRVQGDLPFIVFSIHKKFMGKNKSIIINRSGFTLIELLTVIAIIGILAAVLFPGVQGVMKKAKQSTASIKLRNIVQAVVTLSEGKKYIKPGSWSVTDNASARTIAEYAAVLAYNSSLNSGEIWYVDGDKSNDNASYPKLVLAGAVGSQQIDPNFKNNHYVFIF
jgi:prepilin-type N-terminal cleavage/methylation domain-containing protein